MKKDIVKLMIAMALIFLFVWVGGSCYDSMTLQKHTQTSTSQPVSQPTTVSVDYAEPFGGRVGHAK